MLKELHMNKTCQILISRVLEYGLNEDLCEQVNRLFNHFEN